MLVSRCACPVMDSSIFNPDCFEASRLRQQFDLTGRPSYLPYYSPVGGGHGHPVPSCLCNLQTCLLSPDVAQSAYSKPWGPSNFSTQYEHQQQSLTAVPWQLRPSYNMPANSSLNGFHSWVFPTSLMCSAEASRSLSQPYFVSQPHLGILHTPCPVYRDGSQENPSQTWMSQGPTPSQPQDLESFCLAPADAEPCVPQFQQCTPPVSPTSLKAPDATELLELTSPLSPILNTSGLSSVPSSNIAPDLADFSYEEQVLTPTSPHLVIPDVQLGPQSDCVLPKLAQQLAVPSILPSISPSSSSSLELEDSISRDDTRAPVSRDPSLKFWRCSYPDCASRVLFTRPCDLKKHYQRHFKAFYCRVEGCFRSTSISAGEKGSSTLGPGFSSKKDRLRHEMKHDPRIRCEECGKNFSRVDNMKDHMRRLHKR